MSGLCCVYKTSDLSFGWLSAAWIKFITEKLGVEWMEGMSASSSIALCCGFNSIQLMQNIFLKSFVNENDSSDLSRVSTVECNQKYEIVRIRPFLNICLFLIG